MDAEIPNAQSEWTVLAHLLRSQGRKGEVLANLLTDAPETLKDRPRLFLATPGFRGDAGDLEPVRVESFWLPVGKNEGRIVLAFAGVGTIEAAERLAGSQVITPRSDRLPLGADEIYVEDLVGCLLYDRGTPVGVIEDVQFAMSPDGRRRLTEAAPLLVVRRTSGEESLVPFVKEFLILLDPQQKRINMNLPEGLLDLEADLGKGLSEG